MNDLVELRQKLNGIARDNPEMFVKFTKRYALQYIAKAREYYGDHYGSIVSFLSGDGFEFFKSCDLEVVNLIDVSGILTAAGADITDEQFTELEAVTLVRIAYSSARILTGDSEQMLVEVSDMLTDIVYTNSDNVIVNCIN
ncbi:MAG: hypothetical protein ACRDCE_21910 [Cetobacterium sp.]|uniref:hypothetical protein n=1 Tax=Cetobacterium sp. TaxID=2071632 RepID=UPI003EE65153